MVFACVYNARTRPEVLLAALAATAKEKSGTASCIADTDPQVKQQIEALRLLSTAVPVPRSRMNAGVDQMKSLLALAHLLQSLPGRKALVWVTLTSPVGATELPDYWGGTAARVDQSLLPMYEAAVEELNVAHVSVYPFLFTQANPENYGYVFDSWMGLKQLAESTGGLALRLGQQTSLGAAADAAMNDFGPYYMLERQRFPRLKSWAGFRSRSRSIIPD